LNDSSFHVQKFVFSPRLQLDFGLSWCWWGTYSISYAHKRFFFICQEFACGLDMTWAGVQYTRTFTL